MEIDQFAVRIKSFKQILHSEPFAADMLDLAFVLFIHGFHDQPYQTGRLPGEFLQVDFHRIVRTVHGLSVMDEVAHFHIQQQRLVGILDIECIEVAVFGNYAHVCLAPEMFPGCLHTDHIFRTVRLARYQIGRTQVHISHGRGKNNMYGLVICDFQTVWGNHPAESDLAAQSFIIIPAALLRVCSHCARNQGKHHQNLLHVCFLVDW